MCSADRILSLSLDRETQREKQRDASVAKLMAMDFASGFKIQPDFSAFEEVILTHCAFLLVLRISLFGVLPDFFKFAVYAQALDIETLI
ncbi:hypothetical protein Acr_20g0005960 [Actinidia rufa]|uniref:Uncharacterized protein n=1 Tax=Actinidia rufa TaxID=165716 RepID=A0A7J0GDK7_9ERIC|nr:hypothetical protein Acr_20g0005960 [Actinidia rufa]